MISWYDILLKTGILQRPSAISSCPPITETPSASTSTGPKSSGASPSEPRSGKVRLSEAVRKMPAGQVTIGVSETDIEIQGNGPRFTLRPLTVDDFPIEPSDRDDLYERLLAGA